MNKSWSVVIRQDLKVESVTEKIKMQQLRWFSHLLDDGRLYSKINVENNSILKNLDTGQPRKTWNDKIARVLKEKGLNWSSAKKETEDRKN